jgi:exopolyphosphatase/guanosine-5'-triphosphate,3'-diphosphate pyrophosphatase
VESPEREQVSDEVYLLSRRGDSSVKVRDGLMDVKRLERVDHGGLEQWRPVLKAEFPLRGADVGAVWSALGVEVPALARGEYTLEQLRKELIGTDHDLQAVDVHKVRRHYTVAGAMTELSELSVAAGSSPTVAVESEDPERVQAALSELGLAGRENVNVPLGLKALSGFGT